MRNLKRALSLALSTVMLLGTMMVGASASYADVDPQDKNLEAIEVAQMVGIMVGDEKGNFNPDQIVTRAEMAVIVSTMMDLKLGGSHPFTDVPAWADEYVAACYGAGIIVGYDETHFGANDDVTAVQAAMMLSKTLGYFSYKGELGDDWKVATMKQATRNNMFDKVHTLTNSPLTRSEAAQMVLNTLKATVTMVTEEGGVDVDAGDVSVSVKPSYEYREAVNYEFDYAGRDTSIGQDGGAWTDHTMQLCEQLYGRSLTYNHDDVDDFNRPSAKWTYKTNAFVVPNAYNLVYTGAVSGSQIYKDLNRTNVALADIDVYVNGNAVNPAAPSLADVIVPNTFRIGSGVEAKIGANGVRTEVYFDAAATGSDPVVTIVMVPTYASEVVAVKENDSLGYNIVLNDESTAKAFDSVIEYAEDDIVLYTKTTAMDNNNDQWTDLGATAKVQSMEVAEMVSGTVTRVKDTSKFMLDGKDYEYSKMYNNVFNGKVDASAVNYDMDAYLDLQGNVIMLRNATYMTNIGLVTAKNNGAEWMDDWKVKLMKADGTIEAVSVSQADYALVTSVPCLVKYNFDSDNKYDLSAFQATLTTVTNSDNLKIEAGKAAIKVNGSFEPVNGKTVFFFHNTTSGDRYAWAGIDEMVGLSTKNATDDYSYAMIKEGGMVKAIVITSDLDLIDGTKTSSYFFKNGTEKMWKDSELGDYYELNAVVDGEIVTQKVNTTTYGNIAGNGSIVTNVKTNDKGVVTEVRIQGAKDPVYTGDGYIMGVFTDDSTEQVNVKRLADLVIGLDDGTNGLRSYAYKTEAMVYEYDLSAGEFTAKRMSSIVDGEYTFFAQIDGGFVSAIFYLVP